MVLESVNRMDGGIRGAINSINQLKRSFVQTAKETSNLNPVSGWSEKIGRVTESVKKLGKELKTSGSDFIEKGEKMQNRGLRNIAEGTSLFAPVLSAANKAAGLQMKMTSMQMSGVSKGGTEELIQRADKYTERTLFSKTEIADMFLSMRQSGMKESNILRGSEPMVMLAELENIRRGTVGTETAKVLAQMAERGGILQDPNIERWNEFLELVNKVTTVTTAGIPELHESSKYLEPVARAAGWSEQDMMWSQGIAARFGLEGSVAGTDLKDMVARLNPLKWYKEGRPDQHLDAMNRLGWLQGVRSHVNKSGRVIYDGLDGSVMLREDGSTVNMMEMFGQFAKSWERYKKLPQGRAKFAADMFKVLGEQGEKTALLVSQNYEVIEQMMEDADKVKSIKEQVYTYSAPGQYLQNYKAFRQAIENLEMDAGSTFLESGANFIKNSLHPGIRDLREFTKAHPDFVSAVAKGMVLIGGLKLGTGALKLVVGTLTSTFGGAISGAGTLIGWLSKGARHAHGLYDSFKYFRKGGGKFFESIWKGAQFAYPWLGKLTRWVGRFTPFWLSNAVRIGAGWLIAMGPVGWLIAGATALIAAGVWAWETDFLGFRGVVTDTFNWIRDYADYVCPGMGAKFDELAAGIDNNWKWIKNSTNEALDSMSEKTRGVCDAMGIDFDGVTDKIKTMLTYLSPAAMLWGHIEKFNQYRADKLERNANMANRDYLAQPEYIIPNARGNVSVSQTNNVTVASTNEAADFVGRVEVPKYKGSDYNPLSNGNFAW